MWKLFFENKIQQSVLSTCLTESWCVALLWLVIIFLLKVKCVMNALLNLMLWFLLGDSTLSLKNEVLFVLLHDDCGCKFGPRYEQTEKLMFLINNSHRA